ncbi:MAG: hypothetical protein HOC36_02900 [Candidatus Magasanikbacteria bacterium]|nr:hypothetical protein [Candidatus Magasanikbacteria bacterium]MBT4547270.1 hypothetical protein [Candidatus Magasanikbacteria bacterium]
MKNKKKVYKSSVKHGGNIGELVYDQEEETTCFMVYQDGSFSRVDKMIAGKTPIYPTPPESQIIKEKVVLFPSDAIEYESEEELINDIRNFIHKYLEVSPFFEKIAPFYVLFTWIYDKFKELPYLRAIADYGQGKSRFLKTVGSICYKPMFTVGATTTAPIFRLISQYKGTLILDEADYRFSDTNVEIIKILNNGFQAGMCILRCADSKNNYDLQAFDVFCPKIVATRNRFSDKALESRFLIEHMDGKLSRTDIPLNLDDDFEEEALEIRNKCLAWRLKNYNSVDPSKIEHDKSIEPRLSQIIAPLCSIINDEDVKKELKLFIKEYNKELTIDRGFSFEAPILEIIIDLMKDVSIDVTMKNICDVYNMGIGKSERELSPRKMGNIVKDKFRFKTIKKNVGYVIGREHYLENIDRLCGKYGIKSEQVNIVNVVQGCDDEFVKEIKELGYKDLPSF